MVLAYILTFVLKPKKVIDTSLLDDIEEVYIVLFVGSARGPDDYGGVDDFQILAFINFVVGNWLISVPVELLELFVNWLI